MKQFSITIIAVLTFFMSSAQEFKSNISLGIPVGEVSDSYSINLNLDFVYLYEVTNKFKIGAIAGYTHFVGDSFKAPGVNVKVNDAGFLPIGITSRFIASNKSTLALDFGYAIGFSRGLSGGVFFAPKLYYNLSKTFDAFVSYKSIAVSNYDFGAICFGVEFKL